MYIIEFYLIHILDYNYKWQFVIVIVPVLGKQHKGDVTQIKIKINKVKIVWGIRNRMDAKEIRLGFCNPILEYYIQKDG